MSFAKIKKYFYIYAWVVALALYVYAGFLPDYYAIGNHIPVPSYPVADVIHFSVLSAIECGLLAIIIRPWSFDKSWGRLLVSLILFFLLLFVSAVPSIHAPPIYAAHVFWVLLVCFGIIFSMVVCLFCKR